MQKLVAGTIDFGFQLWENVGGYMFGQNRNPAAGSTVYSYVSDACRVADIQQSEPEFREFIGGGEKLLGRVAIGPSRYGQFTIRLNEINDYLITWLGGRTVNTTRNTRARLYTTRSAPASIKPKGLSLSYLFKDRAASDFSLFTFVFPLNDIVARIVDDNGTKVTELIVNPFETDIAHTGETMSSLVGMNTSDHYILATQNPIHFATFIGNASATTFNTVYATINTTVTVNASPNDMAKNGTPTALASMTSPAGLATLSSAGVSGDKHVLTYEHDYFKLAS